jgi:hypothetical protein
VTPDETKAFDPSLALRTLHHHGVRFVLIGGLAANVLGSPSLTDDLDICYARDDANLVALAAALQKLGARLRGARDPVLFRLDAQTLRRGDSFTFTTEAGSVDVLATPSGTSGYEELEAGATDLELAGVTVKVASLDALMQMKRAAARPKDLIELDVLAALRDEIEQQKAQGG